MSDENGRGEDRHERETDEFGGPLFPDRTRRRRPDDADDSSGALRFGPNDSGSLPHWTDPATGEVPRVLPERDSSDDVDVWSTFTSETPVWKDDPDADPTGPNATPDPSNSFGFGDVSGGTARPADPSGATGVRDNSGSLPSYPSAAGRDPSGEIPTDGRDPSGQVPAAARREPSRIQIGTDPSGMQRREPPQSGRVMGRRNAPRGASRSASSRTGAASTGRDLPTAVIVGVVLAGLFVGAILWRPAAVLALVTAILAIAAFEYFVRITEKGYQPVVAVGIAACVAAPLAAYWLGDETLPLVVAFAFMAGAISFVGATSIESGPLPNMAVTTMAVVWIGLLGAYAALILKFSTGPGGNDIGTDTMFLLTLGVVANDVGAMFVGSATGRTVLRSWISPNKSLEGLIGGTVMTVVALLVVGIADLSDTWNNMSELLILAVVISVMAPLGDLTESMFKRNLDVKDFGAVVKGHGGILDRFDGFLFVLPAVYYLSLVLEPWTS